MRRFLLSFALVLAPAGLAFADTVTIGAGDVDGNVYPFNDSSYAGEYQQVYSASQFSGPEEITAITFFPYVGTPSTTISGDYTIDLSTTSAGVGTLSGTYANNIGANNAQFFSGAVSDVLTFTGGPFLYDPSQGNLLLDVSVVTANSFTGNSLAAGCSAVTERVFNVGGNGAAVADYNVDCSGTAYGLETEFTMTPAGTTVPEPHSLLLLLTAIAAVGLAAGKKRLGRRAAPIES